MKLTSTAGRGVGRVAVAGTGSRIVRIITEEQEEEIVSLHHHERCQSSLWLDTQTSCFELTKHWGCVTPLCTVRTAYVH